MSDGRETKSVHVEVPKALHHLAKESDRTLKELTISGWEHELGVTAEDSVAVIERQIARLEDELEEEHGRLERKRERVEGIRETLEEKRSLRDRAESQTAAYEEALDDLLDRMESGDIVRMFTPHPELRELASKHSKSEEEVHLDLQERAAEQDRDLTVAHFKDALDASEADEKIPIAEKWDNGGDGDDGA